jgi:hypothetical protein
VNLKCPHCGSDLSPRELRAQWGGGSQCVICGAQVRLSPSYPLLVLWGSFPFLCIVLAREGIARGIFFSVKIVIVWFFGSILLAVLLSRIKPPKLKSMSPKEDKHAPIELFDKRRK